MRCTDVGYLRATFGPPGVHLLAHTNLSQAENTPGAATLLFNGLYRAMWYYVGTSGCADERQTRSALELPISLVVGDNSLSAVFISALIFVCFEWGGLTASFMSAFVFPSIFCYMGWGGLTTSFMLGFLFPSTFCCLGSGGLTASFVSAFLFFPYSFCHFKSDTTLPVSFRLRFCRLASAHRMVYCGRSGRCVCRKRLISCKHLGLAFIACG